MKYLITLFIVAIFAVITFSFKNTDRASSDHVKGEMLIQLNPYSGIESENMISTLTDDFSSIGFEPVELISNRMKVWLVKFNPEIDSDEEALKSVRDHQYIQLAQFNHFIEMRETIPNDQDFYQQWNYKNTGQMGGEVGADIKATEAWDINTGGVAATGDTMIVAVVDGGCDLDHPDLNLWKNYHEIPLNGIDDDNNGYVDDYNGWNAYNNTPGIYDDDHGTHVTGIVAAKTDNATGIAGLNWNAKVYPIAGSSTIETTVVRAYSYILEMRTLFNETNGAKGSLIVATNSSFGVNQGQPEDYPIWGAMYDSMGMVGILSAGATANANWDIDVIGDVPTAFDSDYLVSVTNTTRMDEKNQNAAYGLTTIDLGAPGTQVYSTRQSGSYGFKSGTSMASPHIAGATAYLLSAADADFFNNYLANPSAYILKIKQYILDGVDYLPTLQGKTVTGGRLNLLSSLFVMQNPPIMQLTPDSIVMTIAQFFEDSTIAYIENIGGSPLNYSVEVEGDPEWILLNKHEGMVEKFQSDSLLVTLSPNNLAPGVYYSNLCFTYNYYNYDTIPVKLTVMQYTGVSDNNIRDLDAEVYPNPFFNELRFNINMETSGNLVIEIFDAGGKKISTLFNEKFSAGNHEIYSDVSLDSGIYYCTINSGKQWMVKKLIRF